MFSPEDIRLYKSIQAPDTLREKVLGNAAAEAPKKKNHRTAFGAALIAACLALAAVSLYPGASPTIRFEGQAIGSAPVAVFGEANAQMGVRTASLFPTVIELEVSEDADIAVSHGDSERTAAGVLLWSLPSDVTEATVTVTQKNRSTLYFLHADTDGVWYMEKK